MRRGASDSQIVNNFFTLASIVLISGTIAIYTKYIASDTPTVKPYVKLQCEKEAQTYTKVFNQTLLNKSINALNKGYYKLDGGFIINDEKTSRLNKIISIEESDNFYIDAISVTPRRNIEKFLTIKYEIIENDKKNPNKIDIEEKLQAGYVKTSFRINSKEIFTMQSHFDFLYKNAIKNRIECTIKVFKNHVQNTAKHSVDSK